MSMDKKLKQRVRTLVSQQRVMTLGISVEDVPWTAPVYFVFHDQVFFFFSNPASRHIHDASPRVSAAIFYDSDDMANIFGLQMSGCIKPVSKTSLIGKVTHKYICKFDFIRQAFGTQTLKDPQFFLKKFKSGMYGFYPDNIFVSDNSNPGEKRMSVTLTNLQTCME